MTEFFCLDNVGFAKSMEIDKLMCQFMTQKITEIPFTSSNHHYHNSIFALVAPTHKSLYC